MVCSEINAYECRNFCADIVIPRWNAAHQRVSDLPAGAPALTAADALGHAAAAEVEHALRLTVV